MRLGLLGPAEGRLDALESGARLLLDVHGADRVVYLGDDDAADRVVAGWARRIVGEDATDAGIFRRALDGCRDAGPSSIDGFVQAERARLRLRAVECLPRATAKTMEVVDGRVAILLHDKALLDEDDIASAALLVYGRSSEPVVKRVGARLFLSPGGVTGRAGVGLLAEDPGGGVRVAYFTHAGGCVHDEVVALARASRMRVASDAAS